MSALEKYCDRLIGKIFFMLPSFEGRSHVTKEIIYTREEAYANFLKTLNKLKTEINGCVKNYSHIVEFIEMNNIIEGLKDISEDNHNLLRQHIFDLIDICEKIKINYKD